MVHALTRASWPHLAGAAALLSLVVLAAAHHAVRDTMNFVSQAAQIWAHGAIPWWDSLDGIGRPAATPRQSPGFLLPFVLLLALPHGTALIAAALAAMAGAGTFGLLRELKLPPAACWVGACGYVLSLGPAAPAAAAFLPLLLLGVERIARRRRGGVCLLSLGLAWSLLAGDLPVGWLGLLLTGLWALVRLFAAPAQDGAAVLRRMLAAAAIGALLAAPFLVLALQLPASMPGAVDAPADLSPLLDGVTVAAMVLAVAGFRHASPLGWVLAAWMAFGVAKALGLPPFAFLADIVAPFPGPIFAAAAAPGWKLAVIVLAAWGVCHLPWRQRWIMAAVAGAAGVAATLALPPAPVRWTLDPASVELLRTVGQQRVAVLLPKADPAALLPGIATFGTDDPLAEDDLLRLAEAGVRFAVVPRGRSPFRSTVTLDPPMEPGTQALELKPGESITGVFPPAGLPAGTVDRVGVEIGTYLGSSTGVLDIALCRATVCTSGQATLSNAADNVALFVSLAQPLAVAAGDVLRWRATHLGSPADRSVAVWLRAAADNVDGPAGPIAARAARVLLEMRTTAFAATTLRTTDTLEIAEIPRPAAYLAADGCTLTPDGRALVRAECAAPSRLVRRERFLPGWTASIDDATVAVQPADGGMQAVMLPQGVSTVRFAYAPPFASWAWLMSAAGAVLWLAALFFSRSMDPVDDRRRTD